MAKAMLVALTSPMSAEVEDQYNDWYDNVHVAHVLAVEGFVSASRYRVVDPAGAAIWTKVEHRYLALYEIETDDLDVLSEKLAGLVGTEAMPVSEAIDASTASNFFVEPIGVVRSGGH
jgi:hypothetical protein